MKTRSEISALLIALACALEIFAQPRHAADATQIQQAAQAAQVEQAQQAAQAEQSQQPSPSQPSAEPTQKTLPWSALLGVRAAELQQKVPTQDRVVLVPDEATFIDEISKWKLQGRWPVLIEDEIYTPMFLRAFAPKHIVRRTERAAPLVDDAALKAAIEAAVTKAWGGDPSKQSPQQAIQLQGYAPPGLCVYACKDRAFVAAVALGAGRALIPVQIEGEFGAVNDQMDAATFSKLDTAITNAFAATQLPFGDLGDTLEVLALCRSTAHRVVLNLPPAMQPSAQGLPPINPAEPLSVTDALCRTPTGKRYAFCSAIFGSAPRSAYAAMCSLFLQRNSIMAIDCYTGAPQFAPYGFTGIAEGLTNAGFQAEVFGGNEAKLDSWRDRLMAGFACDMLFLNTSGNADFFDLGTPGATPASSRGGPGDIPVLTKPLALHMIHSFSLQQPDSTETLGGRWLNTGVYAYVGSVHEPYLFAFLPPAQVIERAANLVPFVVAARQWDGPFSMPWRVDTLGDPLMLCAAPKSLVPNARVPATPMVPGQIDVLANCRALLAKSKGDTNGTASNAAMHELAISAQDRVAAQLWSMCARQSWSSRVAANALPALFAQRDMDGFLKAYSLTAQPTSSQKDMLWQLWGQHLDRVQGAEMLLLFERSVRPTWPSMDWQRLIGPLRIATNSARVQSGLFKAIEATKNPQQKAALQDLAKGL